MERLQAKLKVGSVVDYGNRNIEANLTAVQGDSEENKTFSMYTPRADLKIHITNPHALSFFEAGEEYVCEFKKVMVPDYQKVYQTMTGRKTLVELSETYSDEDISKLINLKKGEYFELYVNDVNYSLTRVV